MKEIRGSAPYSFFQRLLPTSAIALPLLLAINFLGCEVLKGSPNRIGNMNASKTIEEVLKANTKYLMSIPGVVGIAQGACEDKPCIKVYVRKITPELSKQIPKALGGYEVVPVETGEFEELPQKDPD